MSKDYKPSPQRNNNKSSGFLTGLLVGLLLGVGISLAVTMFIKGGDSPFVKNKSAERAKEIATENIAEEKVSTENVMPEDEKPKDAIEKAAEEANKFDFYTILPETESTVTEQEIKEDPTIKKDNYFLQVGAFQSEADADNMKAKLALQGFEAVVQTATIPEKGIWHRVRVGPLNNLEQINRVRGDLTLNGFNSDLIKVHTETSAQ
jgi:cell division protein FtsN